MGVSTRLFRRLLDDAAVFPPGLAPVEVAVAEFRQRRTGPYAELVGPLLIGAGAVGDLIDVLRGDQTTGAGAVDPRTAPLEVGLIARRGTPPGVLGEAVRRLTDEVPGEVVLTGVEVAHGPGWRDALDLGLPVAVEVDSSLEHLVPQLAEVAGAASAGHRVRAKLRTQSTPDTPLPPPPVLGGFLLACVRRDLPFKLTGGLHHAVRTEVALAGGGTEVQHGLLNVLLATDIAEEHARGAVAGSDAEGGTALERVVSTLTEDDADWLVQRTADLTEDQVSGLRSHFTSYGCCGVLDPIGELTSLNLLAVRPPTDPIHP